MATVKLSALTTNSALTKDDYVVTVNDPAGTPVSHKNSIEELLGVVSDLTAESSLQAAADYVVVYDASAAAPRKVLIEDLPFTTSTHAAAHRSGGSDEIKLDDLASPDDNTDLNASVSAHGLLRKLSGTATEYLDGSGSWSTPAIDINGATTETTVAGAADYVLMYDASASANRKVLIDNLPVNIDGATAEATTDGAADYVLVYDASAAANRKVLLNNLPTGGGGETNTASNVGASGVGVFNAKTGVDLEFNKILGGNNCTISLASNIITVDVDELAASDITSGTLAHEHGGLDADISAIAIGDVIAGTGTGTLGLVTSTGHSDGDVLTLQADGTADWETPAGGGGSSIPSHSQNYISNGWFRWARRLGTSYTVITDGNFGFDRWYVQEDGAATSLELQANRDSSLGGYGSIKKTDTVNDAGIALVQVIPAEETYALRGETVTLQLSAKSTTSAGGNLKVALFEWDGGENHANAKAIVGSWTLNVPTFNVTNHTQIGSTGSMALGTNAFATLSTSGAVSTSAENLVAVIWAEEFSGNTGGVAITIQGCALQVEASPSTVLVPPEAEELAQLNLFYENNFAGAAPAEGTISEAHVSAATGMSNAKGRVPFAAKRSTPTITLRRSADAGSTAGRWAWYDSSMSTWNESTGTTATVDGDGFEIDLQSSMSFSAGYAYQISGGWEAEAEI